MKVQTHYLLSCLRFVHKGTSSSRLVGISTPEPALGKQPRAAEAPPLSSHQLGCAWLRSAGVWRNVGFTGSAAHTIDVRFPDPTATPGILRDYAVPSMIPTSLTFPCVGSGTVAFVPDPTSPTARTSTVTFLHTP
jgi:hypothetical protein